jgi:hypothetical protein
MQMCFAGSGSTVATVATVATGLCTPEFAHGNFESTLHNKAGAAATCAEKEQKVFEFPVLGPIR